MGRELSGLKQHNFVIFRRISTKPGVEVFIFLLNSSVKFHAKICTYCGNINKSHSWLLFMFTLYIKFRAGDKKFIVARDVDACFSFLIC